MFYDAINRAITRAFVAMKREEGQTFVEYSLIGVLIAVALVTVVGLLSTQLGNALTSITNALKP